MPCRWRRATPHRRQSVASETVQNLGVVTPPAEMDAGPNVRVLHAQGGEVLTARSTGGTMDRPVALDREGGMQWRVMVELSGVEGTVQLHEVSTGGSATAEYSAETLGLSVAEGKMTLAGLQHHLVQAQAEEHCRSRRRCDCCGAQRPLKDFRRRRLTSLCGVVEVGAPRFGPCRCGVASRRTISPVADIMPDRCTPEYERSLARMGSLLPYRRARALLDDFFPLSKAPEVETIRQRTLQVGARLEREAVRPPLSAVQAEARSIALTIDGGHVKAVHGYQGRSFEAFVAQVSNDDGKQVVFGSMPAEADSQARQLRGVLHDLGATSRTPVTILSDGADGPRSLGEAGSVGPTYHVLDWFHLSMRIQHVTQTVKGWPDATAEDRQEGARLADIVDEPFRWRLWHAQVQRSLDLIGDTLERLDAIGRGESRAAAPAAKLAGVLRSLETYGSGQSDLIIDYATATHSHEPISTATTESTVQWLLHRRMGANQQMRWSPRGAHLMLKVRTVVVNETFNEDYPRAERWARRPFRRAA